MAIYIPYMFYQKCYFFLNHIVACSYVSDTETKISIFDFYTNSTNSSINSNTNSIISFNISNSTISSNLTINNSTMNNFKTFEAHIKGPIKDIQCHTNVVFILCEDALYTITPNNILYEVDGKFTILNSSYTHMMAINTDTNTYYRNGHIVTDPIIRDNWFVTEDENFKYYRNSCNVVIKLPLNLEFIRIYSVQNVNLIFIDGTFYKYDDADNSDSEYEYENEIMESLQYNLSPIYIENMKGMISRIFYYDMQLTPGNTSLYILDTCNDLWMFVIDSNKFIQIGNIESNDTIETIIEIISFKKLHIIISIYHIIVIYNHQYHILPIDPKLIVKTYLNFDMFAFKYENKWFTIVSYDYPNHNNKNQIKDFIPWSDFICNEYNFRDPEEVFYSGTKFFRLKNEVLYQVDVNTNDENQDLLVMTKSNKKYNRRIQNQYLLLIDIENDIFGQYFQALINKNFNVSINMKLVFDNDVIATGDGVSRSIMNTVIEYITTNLLILDENNEYVFNLTDDFWTYNNYYLFGRLIEYLINSSLHLQGHLNLNLMYGLYCCIHKKVHINELAMFHLHRNPEEFKYISNLDLEYKLNNEKFATLSTGFDNLEQFVLSRLNINQEMLSEHQHRILSLIARGMLKNNETIKFMSMWELYLALGGELEYDRQDVLQNIEINCFDSNIHQDLIDNYKLRIYNLLNSFTNDQLKHFMVLVTGYLQSKSIVSISIDTNLYVDFKIETCFNRLKININVLSNDDFENIFLIYLSQYDSYLVG